MQYAKDPVVDRSLRHSVRDGMASSAMAGSAETYLSAFALFFKASASQVALLATLPALLGALGQLLAAWLNGRGASRKPLIVGGAVMQALVFLPMLALALLLPGRVAPEQLADVAVPILVLLITLYFFFGNLTAPLWTSLMGDLVPEKKRGRFFGRRTKLTTVSSFAGLVVGGLVLQATDSMSSAVWGFVAVFGFACVARLISAWHLSRMHEPSRPASAGELRFGREGWRNVRETGALWFSGYVVLMQAAVGLSGPLFTVYMMNTLEFSYLQLMVSTAGAVLVQVLTLSYWGRIADAFGNRLILSVSSLMIPLLPALWLVSDNFWFLFAIQCVGGLAWGAFSLSSSNLLFDLVPSRERATYSAMQSIVVAAVVFVGGMLGVAMLKFMPDIRPIWNETGVGTPVLAVFMISAVLRLLIAVVLLRKVRELRRPRRQMSTRAFVYRATRFNAFMGLAYEVVTVFRRRPPAPAVTTVPAAQPA